MFGDNSLELRHEASGVRISFCALEALRCWALLDLPPIPHRSGFVADPWDYTFTTTYAGNTAIAALGSGLPTQLDNRSFYARPATDLASGNARLRKPLCKCKGVKGVGLTYGESAPVAGPGGGQRSQQNQQSQQSRHGSNACERSGIDGGCSSCPILSSSAAAAAVAADDDGGSGGSVPTSAPAPEWVPTTGGERLDMEGLIEGSNPPLFVDCVDLFKDDLDPQSLSMLRVRVFCEASFWAVSLRYFCRVNGVKARCLETRFVHRKGTTKVLRERSWKEGDWEALVGAGAEAFVDLEGEGDQVAARRLPLVRPPITDMLILPTRPLQQKAPPTPAAVSTLLPFAWERELPGCTLLRAGGGGGAEGAVAVAISEDGAVAEGFDVATGSTIWHKTLPMSRSAGTCTATAGDEEEADDAQTGGAQAVAVALSPCSDRMVLGLQDGCVLVWETSTGGDVASFSVFAAPSNAKESNGLRVDKRRQQRRRRGAAGNNWSMSQWVEHVQWSEDGRHVGAAAGRDVVLVAAVDPPARDDEKEGTRGGKGGPSGRGSGGRSSSAFLEVGRMRAKGGTVYDVSFAPLVGSLQRKGGLAAAPSHVPAPPDGRVDPQLAIGTYGGVTWLGNGGDQSTTRQPMKIGATAVLAVAVSPDGSKLAVACLDKRVRVFGLGGGNSGDGGGSEEDEGKKAHDWVGFDGAVKTLAWSHSGQFLAAAGGSALLVVPRDLASGEPATLCVPPRPPHALSSSSRRQPAFAALAWCDRAGSLPHRERFLAAIEGHSGRTCVFDVTNADRMTPRRAAPIFIINAPGFGGLPVRGSAPALLQIAWGGGGSIGNAEDAAGDEDHLMLLVLSGCWIGCAHVELNSIVL